MAKNMLISWLNDAYAMEQSGAKMIERFIDDFDGHEDIVEMLEHHLEETHEQADRVRACIEDLGEKVSTTKSVMGNIMGTVQGMSTSAYEDELVKDMLMLHASEHFEHASYLAIASAAEGLGHEEIVTMANELAEQEKMIADWSLQQIPMIVGDTLAQKVEE